MSLPSMLNVVPLYAGVLGIVFLVLTFYVGAYRGKASILIGDGGDMEMVRRMRAQANFVETVPLALILLSLIEVGGASDNLLHGLCIALVLGRICHFLKMVELVKPLAFRIVGMSATLIVLITSSVWLIVDAF